MKVTDLLTATLKLIGAVAKQEPVPPDEMQDAFDRLNSMLDAWAAERLTIFQVVRSVFPLTVGTQDYLIGPGATWNVPRPLWIDGAGLISNQNPVQPLELPMGILTEEEWASIPIKNVPSSIPKVLRYDYAFPKGTVSLWPVPNVGSTQIALYLPTPLAQFVQKTDVVTLPPGYEEALRYNLAVRLCPEFGRPIDPVVATLAVEGFARIQRANKRIPLLEVDEALVGRSNRGVFNWMTGGEGGGRSS